jgi:hypothetical protein
MTLHCIRQYYSALPLIQHSRYKFRKYVTWTYSPMVGTETLNIPSTDIFTIGVTSMVGTGSESVKGLLKRRGHFCAYSNGKIFQQTWTVQFIAMKGLNEIRSLQRNKDLLLTLAWALIFMCPTDDRCTLCVTRGHKPCDHYTNPSQHWTFWSGPGAKIRAFCHAHQPTHPFPPPAAVYLTYKP